MLMFYISLTFIRVRWNTTPNIPESSVFVVSGALFLHTPNRQSCFMYILYQQCVVYMFADAHAHTVMASHAQRGTHRRTSLKEDWTCYPWSQVRTKFGSVNTVSAIMAYQMPMVRGLQLGLRWQGRCSVTHLKANCFALHCYFYIRNIVLRACFKILIDNNMIGLFIICSTTYCLKGRHWCNCR